MMAELSSRGETDEAGADGDTDGVVLSDDAQTTLIKDFKKEESSKLLAVCYKSLTRFDTPVLKAMYLDRNLKDHSLLQAIAHVNRPRSGNNNGVIIDYRGALSNSDSSNWSSDEIS